MPGRIGKSGLVRSRAEALEAAEIRLQDVGGELVDRIELPHPNHKIILGGLQYTLSALQLTDHLTIVGSFGTFLAGKTPRARDIDVLISRRLCEQYWDFLKILCECGVKSVYDVDPRPEFRWEPCSTEIRHALSLRINTCQQDEKEANLDICIKASDLDAIPSSHSWVLDPQDLSCQDKGRQKFKDKLSKYETELQNRRFDEELRLWFSW
jgi:hypothetical protein